jgi:hypothetical protein
MLSSTKQPFSQNNAFLLSFEGVLVPYFAKYTFVVGIAIAFREVGSDI